MPGEDAAREAVAERIAAYKKKGYEEAGASQVLEPAPPNLGSALLLETYVTHADPRLTDELLACTDVEKLGRLAESLYRDERPAIRRALLDYLLAGCDRRGHKAFVKRLFKQAEAANDDEMMAHFVCAFDRLGRRFLVSTTYWNLETRGSGERQRLVWDTAVPARKDPRSKTQDRFSRVTRRYLARRAFRYLRRIGYGDPARYVTVASSALALYRDEHLARAEQLLDAWSLVSILYGKSPVLAKTANGFALAPGAMLSSLTPAPWFEGAWKNAFEPLRKLAESAASRPVRAFALRLLREHHEAALASLGVTQVRRLLTSPHEEVQALGAELFARLRGLEKLPIEEWLVLLEIQNLDAVSAVASAVEKHVTSARVTFAQCAALASQPIASVAAVGLAWLKEKKPTRPEEIEELLRLASAPVARVRDEGTSHALAVIEGRKERRIEGVREIADARYPDAREKALAFIETNADCKDSPLLWLALGESPHADVRRRVVEVSARWLAQADTSALARLVATTLLAVDRGGVEKRRALLAVAERLARAPEDADALVHLFAFALRSVRVAERRKGLVAVTRAAFAHGAVREALGRVLPELAIGAEASA